MGEKKTKSADDLITLEKIKKRWVSFIIVTVFFSLLFGSAWWILFPIVGSLVSAIQSTVTYYTINTKCPNCKSILDEGALFCRNCGIQVMQKCPQCNTPIKGGAYCDKCGTPAAALPASLPLNQAPSQNVQPAQGPLSVDAPKNMRRFCPACGAPVDAHITICGNCGFTL